jgi:hypothetical protein
MDNDANMNEFDNIVVDTADAAREAAECAVGALGEIRVAYVQRNAGDRTYENFTPDNVLDCIADAIDALKKAMAGAVALQKMHLEPVAA